MTLKGTTSMILDQVEAEIQLMKNQNNYAKKYKVWFAKECEIFYEVDRTKSKKIAERFNTELKQCYYNSFKALSEPGMKYYEGYVWSIDVPIPLEHSWLVKDGKVIDSTLILDTDFSKDRTGDEYAGIEISKHKLYKMCLKNGKTGPHLFDYFMEKTEK